jgi:putative cell wall-binding protein
MKIIHFIIPILLLLSAIPTDFAVSNEIAVIASTPADAILAAQYAKEMGYKFVYTPGGELSADAKNAVKYSDKVIMIGGPDAISENVENQLNEQVSSVERVWGADRVDTSLALLKRLIIEKPEALNNIVLAEGFNEDITPVALDFDAPILYFAPDNYEKIAEFMGTLNVQNAVVMGSSVPTDLRNVVTKVSQTTNLALGSAETVIKTALSVASNLNPSILGSVAALVYSEYSEDPLMDAITSYSTGSVGLVVPLPSSNEDTIDEIVSKVTTVTSDISISSDSTGVSDSISEAVSDEGAIVTSVSSSSSTGGGGGSSSSSSDSPSTTSEPDCYFTGIVYDTNTDKIIAINQITPSSVPDSYLGDTVLPTNYTVISVDGGTQYIQFADMGSSKDVGNHVELIGEDRIILPKITINTDIINKSYNDVTITQLGNGNGLNLVYPITSGVITYGTPVNATYYGNSNFISDGQNVTLHVVSDRQQFRAAMNSLLDGSTSEFIAMLNNADKYSADFNSTSNAAEFTVLPKTNGENIVIVTMGNGIIDGDDNVTVLGLSGFEYPKYQLNMTKTYIPTSTTYDFNIDMDLNETPLDDVRYGVIGITKSGYAFTLNINGTDPNNKNFDVSVVGSGLSSKIIDNSDLVSLNADKVKEIMTTAFNSKTTGVAFNSLSKSNSSSLKIVIDH